MVFIKINLKYKITKKGAHIRCYTLYSEVKYIPSYYNVYMCLTSH